MGWQARPARTSRTPSGAATASVSSYDIAPRKIHQVGTRSRATVAEPIKSPGQSLVGAASDRTPSFSVCNFAVELGPHHGTGIRYSCSAAKASGRHQNQISLPSPPSPKTRGRMGGRQSAKLEAATVSRHAIPTGFFPHAFDQFCGIDFQSVCQPSRHCHAHRCLRPFGRAPDHPETADKTYFLALSASLRQAFPCARN